jgi:hypothetical protein
LLQPLAEFGERAATGELQHGAGRLEAQLFLGLVADVLTETLEASAAELHDRRVAFELGRDLGPQALQRVALDLDG